MKVLDAIRRGATQMRDQVGASLLLRQATDLMEVEDFEGALSRFQRVVALQAPRATRLMGYHGTVIALLRLGRYAESLSWNDDARLLLAAWSPEEQEDEVAPAREALEQSRDFARWALAHPFRAAELRERDLAQRMASSADPPGAYPLGRAATWPVAIRSGYRAVVHSLVTTGLVVAAANQGEVARRLLLTARMAARFDRQLERDVYWHLSRLDEKLERGAEAEASRARYEQLNDEVRDALRRLRWTN